MKYKFKCSVYMSILHILAGIALGYMLFFCKTPKSECDAYSKQINQYNDSNYIVIR
jgi:succinate dehydrogenase/fumarate reductase cytochrome b subunit